jgi:outer membrane protein insertion porin family
MTPAQAEGAVTIDGNRRIGADAIKSYFHASDGGHFTDADLDAAVKAMYASGAISDLTTARALEFRL